MHRPIFGEMTQVRFVVVTPDAHDDYPKRIYCSMSIDGWPETGRALECIAPNVYTAAGPMRAGSWVEYKFLREQSWETVEKGDGNSEISNRRLSIKSDIREQVVVHRIATWADRPRLTNTSVEFNAPGDGGTITRVSTLTGDIRTHNLFHSPQLQNARTILVYLPPGYDDAPAERYPVLYMQDGNNIFDVKTSATGVEWGVDETAQRLITQGKIDKVIVVGVFNTPQRTKEYAPFKDSRYGGGLGEAYLEFIQKTLKPFIDSTYRTLPDRAHTGIAGSSLGGLISLYAAFMRPSMFGFAGVVSPALWWAQRKILTVIRDAATPRPLKLWLDMGTDEGEVAGPLVEYNKGISDSRKLLKLLKQKGYEIGADLCYEEIEGGRHHELDWAARVDRMLTFFFAVPTEEAVATKSGATGKARK